MPSVADVMSYADAFRVCPVAIDEDRCVAVRNRNATCRRCADACLAAAITVEKNQVDIDPSACVGCGACVGVCPTYAIQAEDPSAESVISSAIRTADADHGMCVIACARAAAWHVADAERFAEVPCLGHVDEVMLLRLAAKGFDDIILVDGDCRTCKYGAVDVQVDASVDCAAELLDAADAEVVLTRTSKFPDEVLASGRGNVRGEDRRGLMRKTGSYVRRVAGNVAQKTIEDKLGTAPKPRTLKDRLSAGRSGRMPTFQPDGNFALLESMERVCPDAERLPSSDGRICTRRFGRMEVDADACSGCGLCVLFCPTAALSHAEYDEPERSDRKYLEFSAELCTQCGLCEDVCIRRCLKVDGDVAVEHLFDLEPELIEIARPQERTSLFDLKKR